MKALYLYPEGLAAYAAITMLTALQEHYNSNTSALCQGT